MSLLWPTCIHSYFYKLSFLNFEFTGDFIIYDSVEIADNQEFVNEDFGDHGWESKNFFYNSYDSLMVASLFIVLIPVAFVLHRIIKTKFIQIVTKRYYTTII